MAWSAHLSKTPPKSYFPNPYGQSYRFPSVLLQDLPLMPLTSLLPFPQIPTKGTPQILFPLFSVDWPPLHPETQTDMCLAHPHSHSTVSVTSLTASPWMLAAVQR